MKNMTIIALLILATTIYSYSQEMVLLQGSLSCDECNPKSKSDIIFVDISDGKRISSKVNAGDKSYTAVIKSGAKYEVFVKNMKILKGQSVVDLSSINSYTELTENYHLGEFVENEFVLENNLFETEKGSFSTSPLVVFDSLLKINKYQKGIIFNIELSAKDSYFKSITKTEEVMKGKKKVKKKVEVAPLEQINSLLNERKTAIETFMRESGVSANFYNITLNTEYMKSKPKKQKKGGLMPNPDAIRDVVVKISKVR